MKKKNSIAKAVLGIGMGILLAGSAYGSLWWDWEEDYTGDEEGTLLLWKFENTGTEVEPFYGHDSSGNEHHATFAEDQTEVGVDGKFGTGFRSVEPDVNADTGWAGGGANAFDSSQLVVELWFKPYSTNPGENRSSYLFDKMRGDASGANMYFAGTNGDRLYARARRDAPGDTLLLTTSSSLTWDTDTWYHLAYVYSAETGTLAIYRDGVEVASNSYANRHGTYLDQLELATNNHEWRVGNRGMSTHGSAPGVYDNFRVSNIPEPSTLGLILGAVGLFGLRGRLNQ